MHYLLFILLLFVAALRGQAPAQLDALSIPPALQVQAHAVVRSSETIVDVSSPSEMDVNRRLVMTILDQQGLQHAVTVLSYDKFNTVRELKLTVYDASGQTLANYGKKDFRDVAYLDDLTMASDSRYLLLDLSDRKPPFTYILQYVIRSKGIMGYPDFFPQPDYHVSVEKASYEVQLPAGQTLRYKGERSPEPVIRSQGKSVVYSWSFRNLPAIPDEPYNLAVSCLAPAVRLSPGQFEMDGYSGSFDSWDSFARWNNSLLQKLPPLEDKTVQEIKQMTLGLPEIERIRMVYRYLQNHTRYISIQLGIGGWQPFDPNFVHARKYGDCKALAWYTRALLEAAGIKAYYTLIYGGGNPCDIDPGFPHNYFNHVILTVPTSKGDTLWLECTSQTNPFGYVGSFIDRRKALLIDGDKAHVIQMPGLSMEKNVHTDSLVLDLPEGSKTVQLRWHAALTGKAIEENGFDDLAHTDLLNRKKWIEREFAFRGGKIDSFDLQLDTLRTVEPAGTIDVQASSAQLFNVTQRRLYFQPNFFQPWPASLSPDSTRNSPVYRRFGRIYVADLTVHLPTGWSPESMPAAVEHATPFGTYTRTVTYEAGALHYRRVLRLQEGQFPAEQYNELAAFFTKMKKWDAETAVFVRGE